MAMIYKIFRTDEYEDFVARGTTEGASVDRADGFIHFSTADQVRETAAKHFSGEDGLKLLSVDPDALGEALKWEVSRGGELFPHLYRNLFAADIDSVSELPLKGGAHDFEGLLP